MTNHMIPVPPVPPARKFLTAWMVILPIFMLGRVQEAFPVLWPFRLMLISALVTVVALIMHQGFSKARLRLLGKSPTFKWVLALFGVMVLSIFDTFWLSKSISFLKETLLFNSVFLLALNCQVNRRADLNSVLAGAGIATVLLALVCLVMPREAGERTFATYSYDPNDQALMFVIILVLLMPGVRFVKKTYRWCLLVMAMLNLGAIALSQSRGGLLALVAAAFFWGASRGVKGVVKMMALGALVLLLAVSIIPAERLARFTTLFNIENDYNVTADHGRLYVWTNGLKLLKEHPINGTGLGTFIVAEGRTHSEGMWSTAHNSFVQIAVELGVPGLVVFLGLLFSLYKHAKPVNEEDWLGLGIRLALIAYVVGGMFLSWGYSFVLFFLIHIAMVRERVLSMVGNEPSGQEDTPLVAEASSLTVFDSTGRRRYQMRERK